MTKNVTYVDLFAGIGGFAAAFEASGFVNMVSAEFDLAAATTYTRNWGHNALGDVTELSPDDQVSLIPSHTILSAGFPCQPFSKSGAQAGILDKSRGTLFHNILNTVSSAKPALIILENVRNLAGPRHSRDLKTIIESLRALGYRVSDQPLFLSPHRIAPEFGGRPQTRERLFIVATYVGNEDHEVLVAQPLKLPWLEDSTWRPEHWSLDHVIDSPTSGGETLSEAESATLEAWDDFLKIVRHAGKPIPSFPIWTDYWGVGSIPEFTPSWKAKMIRQNQEFYFSLKDLLDVWLQKWEIRNSSKFVASKRKFEWQASNLGSLFEGIIHFRPSGVRVKKANYFPALVAITQTPVIGPLRRRLSVREAARLQGLPDWFDFSGQPESKSYKQLGNGVNVGVVWNVLRAAVLRDSRWLERRDDGKRLVQLVNLNGASPDDALKVMSPMGTWPH